MLHRRLLPFVLLALAGATGALLLAWLSRYREAERVRARVRLESSLAGLAEEVDRRVAWSRSSLSVGEAPSRAALLEELSRRAERDPLVVELWLFEQDPVLEELMLVDVEGEEVDPADWPEDARRIASHLPLALGRVEYMVEHDTLTAEPTTFGFVTDVRREVSVGYGSLLVPAQYQTSEDAGAPERPGRAQVLAVLDREWLAAEALPALAERFLDTEEFELSVAPIGGGQAVWSSSDEGELADPDAEVRLLSLPGRLLYSTDENVFTASLQLTGPPTLLELPSRLERSGAWRLRARHRAGSIDAAVLAAWRRDLTIGALLLTLLTVGGTLLVVAERRARRLAEKELLFVAGVSHELRTPLASISAAAENLADGVVREPTRVREYGRMIASQARRLRRTASQALAFASSDSGGTPARREPVRLDQLAEAVAAQARPALEREGRRLELVLEPGGPTVPGDPDALAAALWNLVDNAGRHADAEGASSTVRLTVSRRGDRALVVVEDKNASLAEDEAARVFEPFERGERAREQQVEGTGLGLALVARTAREHGGEASWRPRAGSGNAFTLELPLSPPDPDPAHGGGAVA